MTFDATEQTLIDDAVRTGGEIPKQPWMQGHRLRALRKEVERIRATMPKPDAPTSAVAGLYNAERRVKWSGDRFVMHHAGADGLPICHLADQFAYPKNPEWADQIEHFGYGPVTCRHCERKWST